MVEKPIFLEIKEKLIAQNRPTEDIEKIEQAYLFAKKGTGEVFEQKESSEVLLKMIEKVMKEREMYINNFINFEKTYFENAAQNIVSALFP